MPAWTSNSMTPGAPTIREDVGDAGGQVHPDTTVVPDNVKWIDSITPSNIGQSSGSFPTTPDSIFSGGNSAGRK